MADRQTIDWTRFRSGLAGTVVRPADGAVWEAARRPEMDRFADLQPAAVVFCRTNDDVARTLDFARHHELPLAVRSGRHDFAGHSTSTGVVLDVSAMNHIGVDQRRATIGAGARLGEVYSGLDTTGRTLPGGCGTTVGIAGLTLGGGLGILGRRYGLLCDRLRQATIVLADGSAVTCDDHRDHDLFWALRGAGHGHFGVVTELRYDTIPSPRCVVFDAHWEHTAAVDVVDTWQRWAPEQTDRLAASLLLNASAVPDEPVRVTLLGAAHDADEASARRLLRSFASEVGSSPATAQLQATDWLSAKAFLTDHAPGNDTGAIFSKSEFHDTPLPSEAVQRLVTTLTEGRTAGEARELDFSPWGGSYNAVSPAATAFPHRTARFLLKHAATVATPAPSERDSAGPWHRRSWTIAHEHGTGGVYPNFPDDSLADPARAYFGANLERLRRIKQAYDPTKAFRPLTAGRSSDLRPTARTHRQETRT